jgi:hypothetical protein
VSGRRTACAGCRARHRCRVCGTATGGRRRRNLFHRSGITVRRLTWRCSSTLRW